MSIVQEYLDLTKKWKKEYGDKTILLMQVGSFLEVYALTNPDGTYTGSNIADFAKINDMHIGSKASYNGYPVAMAGVGIAYIDKYFPKLQENGYTLVIYKQDEVVNGKKITRSLSEIISPGTFFPIETDKLTNNVMCVWIHKSNANKLSPSQLSIGISNIDIYTGKTVLFQLAIDFIHTMSSYDELERYVSAYRPNECLIVSNMEEREIDDIIKFVGLERVKNHKILLQKKQKDINDISDMETFALNAEKQLYQNETIKYFFPDLSLDDFYTTHYIATQALCLLLNVVHRHSPNLVKKLTTPIFENYTNRLVLSNHSLYQLNIIDDTRHNGKLQSVCSLLNNCVTTMGKRKFVFNLHYPTTNEKVLQESYDITEHMLIKGEDKLMNIRNQLNSISDLEKFARKVVTRKVMPNNLVQLVENLKCIEQMYIENSADTILSDYLPKVSIQKACRSIIEDIEHIFCLEKCKDVSEINDTCQIINSGVSKTIDELQKSSIDGRDKLNVICSYFSALIQQSEKPNNTNTNTTEMTQYVTIHETVKSDAVLIGTTRRVNILKSILKEKSKPSVSLTYKSKYNKQQETFDLDLSTIDYVTNGNSSNSKSLVITSKQIREISNDNQEWKDKLIKEIQMIFNKYITDFSKFDREMQDIIKYVTEMDMLQCKWFIAHKYNYCKPEIYLEEPSSFFAFTGIRHPLIEHLQTNELYVTNDLELGENASANTSSNTSANGLLLYGTNAVGKTSLIKSIGIAVIMAQAGLYVSCLSFRYKPYQNIFTRILGNDNLFKGLSTFAVEMSELRTILLMANKNSLVLGDELCSGTESDSALSIFTAGLEILHEKKCTFLFATHFHEINKYDEIKALTKLKMMHMSVKYNKETNALIYDRKLQDGPGESMYGLEVCKSLNLPDEFLKRAHDIRIKYNPESRDILSFKQTHFNANKLVGNCEICKVNKASEVHHLQHQKKANKSNSYIINDDKQTFHKNHVANLLNICETCHKKIHHTGDVKNDGGQHKVVKTTSGYVIRPL